MEEIKVKRTKLLSSKNEYRDGVNSPTVINKYRCLCGLGKIVEENVIGFNDHFAYIKCKLCLLKYQSFVDFCGDEWIVYKK